MVTAHGVSLVAGLLAGIFGAILAAASTVHASPWGQTPKARLVINQLEHYGADHADRRFGQLTVQTYAEWGASPSWTVGGKLAQGWQATEQGPTKDARSGIVDADLFVQRRIGHTDANALSVQGLYSFGTAIQAALADPDQINRDDALQIGLLYGQSGEPLFRTGTVAYRHSLGGDADQLRLDIGMGYHTQGGRLYLWDIHHTQAVTSAGPTGLEYNVTRLSASIVWPLSQSHRLQIGGRMDVAGRHLDEGAGFFIALWSQR